MEAQGFLVRALKRVDCAVACRLGSSLYTGLSTRVLGWLYHHTPGWLLNRGAKLALEREHGPRWLTEAYQLAWLASGFLFLAAARSFRFPFALLALLAVVRLVEILVSVLHWLLVATDDVEAHRRSLLALTVSLLEIAVYSAALRELAGCGCALRGMLGAWHATLVEVLSGSAPAGMRGGWCSAVAHTQLLASRLLLLVGVTMVLSWIRREERSA